MPSQSFAFYLVRRAISRDAVIVLGRIAATWRVALTVGVLWATRDRPAGG
ncbi:hypothetical protein [Streptomyces sp. CB00316]|nr:hypothetical protein [Streptomyces sp. CB00316]